MIQVARTQNPGRKRACTQERRQRPPKGSMGKARRECCMRKGVKGEEITMKKKKRFGRRKEVVLVAVG